MAKSILAARKRALSVSLAVATGVAAVLVSVGMFAAPAQADFSGYTYACGAWWDNAEASSECLSGYTTWGGTVKLHVDRSTQTDYHGSWKNAKTGVVDHAVCLFTCNSAYISRDIN